jgi:hypothetical protein
LPETTLGGSILDRDPEFLIELPTDVQVLEIRAAHGDTGGG